MSRPVALHNAVPVRATREDVAPPPAPAPGLHAAAPVEPALPVERAAPAPVNVLVVDDHAENRVAIRAILESPEYRIVEASSGGEALRCLLREEFALVLLDVVMPGMDGFEVASIIKQRDRTHGLPIIFLTAQSHGDLDAMFKGYTAGAVDYLIKPVSPELVRAKVAVFAELYRQRDAIRRSAERERAASVRERDVALAEAQLVSDRRYHNLAEAIPQIVWTTHADGRADYFNQRWFDFTGMGVTASATAGWTAAVDPADRARCEAAWGASLASGEMLHVACQLTRGRDGVSRWHLCRAVPERDAAGQVIAWIGTLTDIDDQKRTEAELAAAVRLRDEFLSVASHELRTPLATLQLQVDSLMRRDRVTRERLVSDVAAARLEKVVRQVGRLTRLVDQLLDVSRITAGPLHLERDDVDLAALAREVAARLADEAARADTRIELRVGEPVVGRWDPVRIEQVVTNLLSNAIKYGAGQPVELEVRGDARAATIVVRDRGIGIAGDHVDKIFGRFERAVSERNYGGLGLGLFIVRQIVAAHGGTVRAESQLGQGATFTVELPRM